MRNLLQKLLNAMRGSEPQSKSSPEKDALNLKLNQFEIESEAIKRITAAAEAEIGRCWTAYGKATGVLKVLIVTVATLVTGLAVFFGWRTMAEIRQQAQETAKREIEKQFENESIKKLVNDAAKERVELVADRLIQSNIDERITPIRKELFANLRDQEKKLRELETNLWQSQMTESNLQQTAKEAKVALKQLNEDSDFISKAFLAENDDRSAYEQLVTWASDRGNPRHDLAGRFVSVIQSSYYDTANRAWPAINWNAISDGSNRSSWNIDQIVSLWNQMDQRGARDYLTFVWGSTNLTREQRLSFLRKMYLSDSRNSLLAADEAGKTVSKEIGAQYNPPFQYSDLEKRWAEYCNTSHLFTIQENCPTNIAYEIFWPSSTNHIHLLKDWGRTKLVLFELQHTPVFGSIEGMFIDYRTALQAKLLPTNTNYLSTVSVYFNGQDTNMTLSTIKCELKYTIDPSKPTVKGITVTTNSVIFDGGVLSVPLPP